MHLKNHNLSKLKEPLRIYALNQFISAVKFLHGAQYPSELSGNNCNIHSYYFHNRNKSKLVHILEGQKKLIRKYEFISANGINCFIQHDKYTIRINFKWLLNKQVCHFVSGMTSISGLHNAWDLHCSILIPSQIAHVHNITQLYGADSLYTSSVKKLSTFYGTERFISVFIIGYHWSVSLTRSIQSPPYYANSFRSIYMLSFQHT